MLFAAVVSTAGVGVAPLLEAAGAAVDERAAREASLTETREADATEAVETEATEMME